MARRCNAHHKVNCATCESNRAEKAADEVRRKARDEKKAADEKIRRERKWRIDHLPKQDRH